MAITAQDVNKLRQMTGAGMMDCKKALVEAEGDFDKAIEILRKKGQKVSASRADRETNEGIVIVKTNEDHTVGVLVAFSCETDFVAKNDAFVSLGEELATAAFTQKPADAAALKALKADGDLTFDDKITELIGKIGEKLDIVAYEVMEGEAVVPYIHAGSKLGVLVSLKNTNGADVLEAGKDVGMQIAAMNPVAVDKDGVDATVVEKEIEIGKDQARQEGKPEAMLEKIALGKLNKFYKENTLLSQAFVKDNGVNISQYLDSVSKGMTVAEFKRITIG
ncbi:translation elongation factor Ts [Reichenbachiella carrageenanivorans]|uniref:Elongation factor Ts n=1 Tax=Reichenbachiella carrageenanivorans TaxID=2979869 RepID=A0ABY6D643_9BACT|nr:translation elongation factor Ts [Reichenbachiella carrageenanivorans]UXX81384.1 translation elongation factor Ts [Reichenbachiella carrageenanivorans]